MTDEKDTPATATDTPNNAATTTTATTASSVTRTGSTGCSSNSSNSGSCDASAADLLEKPTDKEMVANGNNGSGADRDPMYPMMMTSTTTECDGDEKPELSRFGQFCARHGINSNLIMLKITLFVMYGGKFFRLCSVNIKFAKYSAAAAQC